MLDIIRSSFGHCLIFRKSVTSSIVSGSRVISRKGDFFSTSAPLGSQLLHVKTRWVYRYQTYIYPSKYILREVHLEYSKYSCVWHFMRISNSSLLNSIRHVVNRYVIWQLINIPFTWSPGEDSNLPPLWTTRSPIMAMTIWVASENSYHKNNGPRTTSSQK